MENCQPSHPEQNGSAVTAREILIALVRAAVCAEPAPEAVKAACSEEMLAEVWALARRHDVQHLAGHALGTMGLAGSAPLSAMKTDAFRAALRYEQQNAVFLEACRVLDGEKIPYIPLKGAVIRSLYPQPWMRNSCDIDILVEESRLEQAVAALCSGLKAEAGPKSDHDISLMNPAGVNLELHYDMVQERYETNNCRDVLVRVWEDSRPAAGSFCRALSDEMFYFYHMAHMAKHFATGGCGIRAYLDIWMLNHRTDPNRARREALLAEGGLLSFASGSEKLAQMWFSGENGDEMTLALADYTLRSSLYGGNENRAAVGQARMGGKGKYLLQRVFMPYDYLKAEYPVLKKHKWLTPVYQVVRWLRMLFAGQLLRTVRELRANVETGKSSTVDAKKLLKYLDI